MLRWCDYRLDVPMKFYNLPLEKPEDHHKWFFSAEEGEEFIKYRAEKNGMKVIQLDFDSISSEGLGWRGRMITIARNLLLQKDFNFSNLYKGTLWAVLEKNYYG